MNCNCTWVESILAILVILFAFWETTYSQWIIVIAGVLLLLHALLCKNCKMCRECMDMKGSKPVKSSRRSRRR